MRLPVPCLFALALVSVSTTACERAANNELEVASSLVSQSELAPPNVVDVFGIDYAFNAPEEIQAGLTTFRFANHGAEPHHLILMRLHEGATVDDLIAAMRDGRPLTGIATSLGGPNAPGMGETSNATLNLEPGEYALVCVVPSPDGELHLFKGMVKPIRVTGEAAPARLPVADVEIVFSDYAFEVLGEIEVGQQTIRAVVDPQSVEPHEVVIARLAPGASAEDLNDWMHAMDGPPPAEFLGGATVLDPGESVIFTADFTPGEYAMVCPLPSVIDGEPHSYKGMIKQFTVSEES